MYKASYFRRLEYKNLLIYKTKFKFTEFENKTVTFFFFILTDHKRNMKLIRRFELLFILCKNRSHSYL